MKYFIGIDLGGTNIKVGLVDEQGVVIASSSTRTPRDTDPDRIITRMTEAAGSVARSGGMQLTDISGIGIGSPGPIDLEHGVVIGMPNLNGWDCIPLCQRIEEATGVPTTLENDANAAAFGEFWAGAGRDPNIRDMVMVTLGTGIGTGLIIAGKIVHGARGVAGEGGHMVVQPDGRQCGCGQRGCLEAYASAANTARRAEESLAREPRSVLHEVRKANNGTLTSKHVFDAANAADPVALAVVRETARYLAVGCVSFCRILDPSMIVFAGGMILAGDLLFEMVREAFADNSWNVMSDHVRIVPAELGNEAGFIGAAAIACDAGRTEAER